MKKIIFVVAFIFVLPQSILAKDICRLDADSQGGERYFICDAVVGKIGKDGSSVIKELGQPTKKDKFQYSDSDGSYYSNWSWKDRGISIVMVSESTKGDRPKVDTVYLKSPCTLTLDTGVRIGSTETDVKNIYGKYSYIDKELPQEGTIPGEQFAAGNPYGGIMFKLRQGKVYEIIIGSWGAE